MSYPYFNNQDESYDPTLPCGHSALHQAECCAICSDSRLERLRVVANAAKTLLDNGDLDHDYGPDSVLIKALNALKEGDV